MKKGFTLIELLAVVVLLSVIALIAYPILNSTIKTSKEQALQDTISNLESIGHMYGAENTLTSSVDEQAISFESFLDGGYIKRLPTNPVTGENLTGCIMYSWRNNQYVYRYDKNCAIKQAGKINMEITFTPLGSINNGWYKSNFYVKIEVSGNSYKWCSGTSECDPTTLVSSNAGSTYITTESISNVICVIGYDYEDYSEKLCSPAYKLDKTSPIISGISDVTVLKNSTVDLTTGVSTNDDLSWISGSYSYSPTNVDTSTSGIKTVTYTVNDLAGNTASITKNVTVETDLPTIAFSSTGEFNVNGWANSNFYITATATPDSSSSISSILWCSGTSNCTPSTSVSASNVSAYITTNSASNVMCAQAVDATGHSGIVTCSNSYKLDKALPTIVANVPNLSIEGGSNHISSNYFTATYGISGVGSISCNPTNTMALGSGSQTISCTAIGLNDLSSTNATIPVEVTVLKQEYTYVESDQTYAIPVSGNYKIEAWGAQGYSGGNGGYASGQIYLSQGTILQINTGGNTGYNGGGTGRAYAPETKTCPCPYNCYYFEPNNVCVREDNGYNCGTPTCTYTYGTTVYYNGGGSTTIKLDSTNILIAAGGGGGTNGTAGGTGTGIGGANVGAGAGGNGTNGSGGGESNNYVYQTCTTCPYNCYYFQPNNVCVREDNGYNCGSPSCVMNTTVGLSGTGGANYIGTLANGTTISGNASMPSTSGSTEIGHSGNGYVRIIYLGN